MSNNLDSLKQQLNEINTKRVRVQTLIEQAKKQCELIEQKYNVSTAEELKSLVDTTQAKYEEEVALARKYIEDTNAILSKFNGLM